MKRKNHQDGIQRREFLQRSVTFAAGTLLMGSGTSKLFGAADSHQSVPSIDTVTLNNGIQMPILGFGTLYLNDEVGV